MKNRKDTGKPVLYIMLLLSFLVVIISFYNRNSIASYLSFKSPAIVNIFNRLNNKIDLDSLEPYFSIEIVDEGYDIYKPSGNGYRYGPSIIKYEDGTMDAYFASEGNSSSQWDYIRYRHFDGENWGDEKIVLKPTKKSLDHYSVCDPAVICFDGYYYLAYTSTDNATDGGVENNLFVARSTNPDGPFEKWDGEGWSDNPTPIIEYTNNDGCWGIGEASFVVADEKLYCYYSEINKNGTFTKLAVADLCENWPSTLEDKGIVISKSKGQDSCDIVFNQQYHRFVAFCIQWRFDDKSCIAVYESKDGINFEQVDGIQGIDDYAHNMGIAKSELGHVELNEELIVGYAYGNSKNSWGKWATKFKKAQFKLFSK